MAAIASLAGLCALCTSAPAVTRKGSDARSSPTLFGFTPFPYDSTLEALKWTHDLDAANSTLWAIHYDDSVPWQAMEKNAALPARLKKRWDDDLKAVPRGHVVYLALCPLDKDRHNLAPDLDSASAGYAEDASLRVLPLDNDRVVNAYTNYVLRAVKQFHPRYLNVGIEAGQMLPDDLARWREFCGLYTRLAGSVRRTDPHIQIGISFKLATLRAPGAWEAAQPVISACDYIGLSFYPFASPMDEHFGAPPFTGDAPWREPLDWIEAHATKPIAICETGYTTVDISIPQYKLQMHGSEALQADYVRDLFSRARSGKYEFVIWFLSTDYEALYTRMPAGSDVLKIWKNIGLVDGSLRPKPAFSIWQEGLKSLGGHKE